MNSGEEKPYKTFRVGGRSFSVYLMYDDQMKEKYPLYPDFESKPEYTGEGRPFATAEQESCSFTRSRIDGGPPPGDCGGCGYFYRETTPYDPIGICMCELRRRNGYVGEK